MKPEEQHIISFRNAFYSGKKFYDAVRYLRDKIPLIEIGIETVTPADKFVLDVLLQQYSGTGELTTWPEDVAKFICDTKAQVEEMKHE